MYFLDFFVFHHLIVKLFLFISLSFFYFPYTFLRWSFFYFPYTFLHWSFFFIEFLSLEFFHRILTCWFMSLCFLVCFNLMFFIPSVIFFSTLNFSACHNKARSNFSCCVLHFGYFFFVELLIFSYCSFDIFVILSTSVSPDLCFTSLSARIY